MTETMKGGDREDRIKRRETDKRKEETGTG